MYIYTQYKGLNKNYICLSFNGKKNSLPYYLIQKRAQYYKISLYLTVTSS